MLDPIILFLQQTIVPLGMVGIFLGAVLEEVIAPIPSAAVLFTAGFLFLKDLSGMALVTKLVFYIAIPAAAGIAIGALFIYGLVYVYGKPFIGRWGKWLGISWSDIEKLEKKIADGTSGGILLFTLRAIPVIPNVAVTAFFGLIRMHWSTFLVGSFLGAIIRASVLAYIGYHLGGLLENLANVLSVGEMLITLSIVGTILYFVYKNLKKRKANSQST